jgi:hypothetical protein
MTPAKLLFLVPGTTTTTTTTAANCCFSICQLTGSSPNRPESFSFWFLFSHCFPSSLGVFLNIQSMIFFQEERRRCIGRLTWSVRPYNPRRITYKGGKRRRKAIRHHLWAGGRTHLALLHVPATLLESQDGKKMDGITTTFLPPPPSNLYKREGNRD